MTTDSAGRGPEGPEPAREDLAADDGARNGEEFGTLPHDEGERDPAGPDGGDEDRDAPAEGEAEELHTALPPRIDAWRRRSATGAMLTGMAIGLQQVFEPKRDEPAIVMETSGDPPRDLPVEAEMEYRRPRQTVVNIRPWLLDGGRPRPPVAGGAPGPTTDTDPDADSNPPD